MPLRAILLDLDGTLVDSAEDLRDALNAVLAGEGLRAVGLEECKGMIGDGAGKLVERALRAAGGSPDRQEAALARFLAAYEADPVRRTRPYPGVVETLGRLRERGLRLAVVTNKPEAATRAVLRLLNLSALFDAVVGGDTAERRKPDPAPVRLALARLGVEPGEALMVGDNHHDVAAARAAGVRAVAVTYGYSHVPHPELGADRLIGRFEELLGEA